MKGKKLAALISAVTIGLNVTLPIPVALANENFLQENELFAENAEMKSYLDLDYDGKEQTINLFDNMELTLDSWKDDSQTIIIGKIFLTNPEGETNVHDIEINANNVLAPYRFEGLDTIYIAAQEAEVFSFEERQISNNTSEIYLPFELNEESEAKERLAIIDEFGTVLKWKENYKYFSSEGIEISEEEYLTPIIEEHIVIEEPIEEVDSKQNTEEVIEEIPQIQTFSMRSVSEPIIQAPSVIYSTHVQSKGWLPEVKDSQMSGTSQESKRIEALKVRIEGVENLGISYSTHVQSFGWMTPVSDNVLSGTEGLSKRVEAVKMNLTGSEASNYDIYYRVHVEKFGWLDWAQNGAPAGTEGMSRRVEALEIKLVKKGEQAPTEISNHFVQSPVVWYSAFVAGIGWQLPVGHGLSSGTEGEQKRLEAINLGISSESGIGLRYSTHMQSYGWTEWINDNATSGLPGGNKRMEAMRIELTGVNANHFDIYYRVHSQKFGWLGWAKNGEPAGTEGYGYRSEAYQVRVVPKGTTFNRQGSAYKSKDKTSVVYNSHVQKLGWLGASQDGTTNGTQGRSLRMEALTISLNHDKYAGNISYSTHIQKLGWVNPVNNGAVSGTTGEAKRLEGLRINLEGEISEYYDIYYRVYVQTYGWLGWAKNGMSAGTEGLGKRLESVEIKLIEKGLPTPNTSEESAFRRPAKKKVIFLDIGHGGADPGAQYYGVNEKDLNLQIGFKVQRDLEKAGYAVIMSRTSDTYMDYKTERSRIANGSGADIFISLHNNAMPGNSYVNGIETYYYESDPNYVPRINKDMHNNPDRIVKSSILANTIHNNLINYTGAYDRGVRRDTFAVLRETALPAVLLEFGFMSNPSELNKLKTEGYQNTLSRAVTNGVKGYFETY